MVGVTLQRNPDYAAASVQLQCNCCSACCIVVFASQHPESVIYSNQVVQLV